MEGRFITWPESFKYQFWLEKWHTTKTYMMPDCQMNRENYRGIASYVERNLLLKSLAYLQPEVWPKSLKTSSLNITNNRQEKVGGVFRTLGMLIYLGVFSALKAFCPASLEFTPSLRKQPTALKRNLHYQHSWHFRRMSKLSHIMS